MNTRERLYQGMDRFFSLRQHSDDARFKQRLCTLQTWQASRLRYTHRDYLDDPRVRPGIEFLLAEVYGGRDLTPVGLEIRRALPKALRLLPDSVMATSATTLEAAIITQELDEALVLELGDALDISLKTDQYAVAYRQLGQKPLREKQLQLVSETGHHIDRYVRNRMVQRGFRLLRRPVIAAGFGSLYGLMDRGFSAMGDIDRLGHLLQEMTHREARVMQRLFDTHPDPFDGAAP